MGPEVIVNFRCHVLRIGLGPPKLKKKSATRQALMKPNIPSAFQTSFQIARNQVNLKGICVIPRMGTRT